MFIREPISIYFCTVICTKSSPKSLAVTIIDRCFAIRAKSPKLLCSGILSLNYTFLITTLFMDQVHSISNIIYFLYIIICVMNIICFFAWVLIDFLFNHEIQGHYNSLVGHRTTALSASDVVLRISMYRNERKNK